VHRQELRTCTQLDTWPKGSMSAARADSSTWMIDWSVNSSLPSSPSRSSYHLCLYACACAHVCIYVTCRYVSVSRHSSSSCTYVDTFRHGGSASRPAYLGIIRHTWQHTRKPAAHEYTRAHVHMLSNTGMSLPARPHGLSSYTPPTSFFQKDTDVCVRVCVCA
jgi:hypothetical protein